MFKKNILEKNLCTLKNIQPITWNWLKSNLHIADEIAPLIKTNKHDLIDIKLADKFLMENIDLSLYKNWILNIKDTRLLILIGCNIGYGINVLLRKTSNTKIIVIEPDIRLLLACLGVYDYSQFILKKRVVFISNSIFHISQTLEQFIPYILHSKVQIILDWSALKNKKYIKTFSKVSTILKDIILALSTIKRRQEETIENEIQNFSRVFKDGTLFPLKNKFLNFNFSCIIIGAGPSLKEQISMLKKCQDKIISATSFQTLPSLFLHDFKPTIALALDYTSTLLKAYDKIDKKWLEEIPLIYSPKVHPEVITNYPGITIPVWTIGGLGTYINPQKDLVIESGGNASVTLIRLMYELGFRNFYLIGQDFSWRENNTHSEGHHASEKIFTFNPKKHIKRKNRYGETIYTTATYLAAVHEIEKDIEQKNIKVYNVSDRGLEIPKSLFIDLTTFENKINTINKNQKEIFIKELKKCKKPRCLPVIALEYDQWCTSLNNVERRLKKLYKNKNQKEIKIVYNEILIFLKQHPIYTPYIYNELLKLSKYSIIKERFLPIDLKETLKILSSVKKKIRNIDKKFKEVYNNVIHDPALQA